MKVRENDCLIAGFGDFVIFVAVATAILSGKFTNAGEMKTTRQVTINNEMADKPKNQ